MNYSPKNIQELVNNNKLQFKKKFGQNFIIDQNIIDNIIIKANIDSSTLVVEIGPGIGALTHKLSQSSKNVLCYEIDITLKEILENNLKNSKNVDILYQDFLKSYPKFDIAKYNYDKLYLVANLPYYITTPIIIKIIEDDLNVDKMVVMVQKEVGDRFKAKSGTKDYNSLSIYLNYYYDVKKLLDVSKNVFFPKPNVDSIVLEFTKKKKLEPLTNKELFFGLVRDSFKQKRKTIKNNLGNYDLNKIEKILKKYGFDLNVRAEQLDVSIFIDIANNL